MKVVESREVIKRYQNLFIRNLISTCDKKIEGIVGHRGSSNKHKIYYSTTRNVWFCMYLARNRFWNSFGFGEPSPTGNNSITVEINFPYTGVNRRVGAVFAETKDGEILILHRGKIGGGKENVGKTLFFENYRDDILLAEDGDKESEFCFIGSLKSHILIDQVAHFVTEVYRIKHIDFAKSSVFSFLKKFSFSKEKSGKSKFKTLKNFIERTHGIVVNALAKEIENLGFSFANDRNRDLFTYNKEQIQCIFEVKRSASTQDLCSAVGQLLIYSMPIKNRVHLYVVLPETLADPVTKKLRKLGVQVLYYHWNKGNPVFVNLKQALVR